jgi:DNA-directed RNA polymerase specialized sigma24 family protein
VWLAVWVRWVADAELRHLVARVATWPAPMRQVFTLRKVYGLAPPQIARRLGLTDAQVERHLIAAALAVSGLDSAPDPSSSEGTTPS